MKRIINIRYHSIFKYDEHQETIKFEGQGYLHQNNEEMKISYFDKKMISIVIKENEICLLNGDSVLKMSKHLDIINQYDTDYGSIELVTRLISYENKDVIKIRYELYDGDKLLSKVYVMINYQELEN